MEEQNQNSENRIGNRVIVAVFLLLVFGLTIAGFFSPVRARSESENRNLAQKPVFSWEALFTKDEQKRFTVLYENYLSDQFVARDAWIGLKTRAERLLGKTDINGVYFAEDGYLITKTDASAVDKEREEKNIARLVEFVEKYLESLGNGHVHAMIVPTAAYVLAEKMPPFTSEYNQGALLDRLGEELPQGSFIDAREELLAHAKEYIYYRTDHHQTALGAYYDYRAWAKATGHVVRKLSDYEMSIGSEEFYGTLYSKINLPMRADTVTIYDDGKLYRVEYDMSGKPRTGLYAKERLEEKDKYMVYLDGNHAMVDIVQQAQKDGAQTDTTGQAQLVDAQKDAAGQAQHDGAQEGVAEQKRTLLVIKDSYAHTFVPFLAQDYDRVIMIDFRYSKMPVSMIVKQYGVTDILVMYNATNFVEDENLYQLER
ncbi:MAG: hypothetical protein K2O03_11660 [Lachnospiraceae bacterium]|nr:hypothetical protein [Lachnospiraceae bacterium]